MYIKIKKNDKPYDFNDKPTKNKHNQMRKMEINKDAIKTLKYKTTTEIREALNYYYELINRILKMIFDGSELNGRVYEFIEIHLQLICIYERELVRRKTLYSR